MLGALLPPPPVLAQSGATREEGTKTARAAAKRLPKHTPYPRPRPRGAQERQTTKPANNTSAPSPAANSRHPEAPAEGSCRERLGQELASLETLPPISEPGGCGIAEPVRLTAIVARNGARVLLDPPPVLACDMAEALVRWVRDDLPAALAPEGGALSHVLAGSGYECRGRNRVAGARMSAHALGNAIDLRALKLNGKDVSLTEASGARELRARVQSAACARFSTVLGPGSDGFHEDHIHLDVTRRRSGYRICQWEVR